MISFKNWINDKKTKKQKTKKQGWGTRGGKVESTSRTVLFGYHRIFKNFVYLFLTGGQFLHNIVLTSAIHQCESVTGMHMSPPSRTSLLHPPHPTPLGCHRAPDLSSLCHSANFHWLSKFTYVVYMFQSYSLNLSHLHHSLSLHRLSVQFSSVQFSHSVVSDPLRPHESQHARPPCPSSTLGVYPNPYSSS